MCSGLLSDMAMALPSLSAIAVINPNGYFRCGPLGARPPPFLGDREYFIQALSTQDRVVGIFTIERSTGKKVLPIALRIGGTEGAPLGVAVAYIDLEWLQARLQERTYVSNSSLTIADRNGTILARVPEPERFVGTDIPEAFRYLLTMPETGTLELPSQDGTRRIVGYVPIMERPKGLYVSAGFATDTAFASTQVIFTRGVVIGLAGVIAALLLVTYTSRVFIALPVQNLVDTVQEWRAGKTDARTGMSARDGELGSAGQAFDEFMEELLTARKARRQAECQRQMLLGEMEHRGKNLLAMVQAVARRTFSRMAGEPEMRVFSGRLQAIGEANSMLRREHWQRAALEDLVRGAMAPFVDTSSKRINLSGPHIFLKSDVVLPLSMAFHELCTNAVKYGALSNDTGTVSVAWEIQSSATGETLEISWRELGGPTVVAPAKRGFGSNVIEQVLSSSTEGQAYLVYDPKGVISRMTIPADKALARDTQKEELRSVAV